MSSGLLALLDDVAAIAKVAAASLDDVATQTAKAGAKAAGIVIDDAAVTPRYVVGFAAERELPIVARIAWGSLKNKILFLLPGALLLSAFAPWAIMPLLVLGGAYLCFEGYEKLAEWFWPHAASEHGDPGAKPSAIDAKALEDQRVAGAIRTDMILSAEIMAIALATVANEPLVTKALSLFAVAILVTGMVYGVVGLIVKADDAGVVMSRSRNGAVRSIGRLLVTGMPWLLKALSVVGTLAMLWVGGGIIVHGLHEFGLAWPEKAIHAIAHPVGVGLPVIGPFVAWLIGAAIAGLFGAAIGFVVERAVHTVAGKSAH